MSKRRYRRKRKQALALLSLVAAMILLISVIATRGVPLNLLTARAVDEVESELEIHYFNNDVQDDGNDRNNYNFGPDRMPAAKAAVEAGEVDYVQNYIATDEQTGDFWDSLLVDPALLAAVALDLDLTLDFEEKILAREQSVVIGQRANAAHKNFLDDPAYRLQVYDKVKERLSDAEISLVGINSYTSSMYMRNNELDGDKPSVIVRNTNNAGGTFVQFKTGHGTVKFRIECGYQPVDVPDWNPPENKPPVEDNPEPVDPPTPPPGPPTPPPPGPPTPPPGDNDAKDPNAGPNGVIADDEEKADFGGSANQDVDKTVTPEPTSPDTYTPPPQPSGGNDGGNSGGGQQGNNPADDYRESEQQATDESRQNTVTTPEGQSGSNIVENDNGKTGTTSDGDSYTVQAGDGQTRDNLDNVQQQHSESTVEPTVSNDNTNAGDVGAPD